MWNSNSSQPGALEFEVMDMLHKLEFRDWMGLDTPPAQAAPTVLEAEEIAEQRDAIAANGTEAGAEQAGAGRRR